MRRPVLPDGLNHVRTTAVFDNDTVPAGLLRTHRVADGVWGRLVVHSGSVGFLFEDSPGEPSTVTPDEPMVIPPGRLHHVVLDGPARFAVEFHRAPEAVPVTFGRESSGLHGGGAAGDGADGDGADGDIVDTEI